MWIVFNPTAGAARRRRLERAIARLPGAELVATTAPGDAARLARQGLAAGYRHIVAAGGDGPIAEVAGALAGQDAALGILPLGTANVLAQELGLPLDAAGAAQVIAAGRTARLHPGFARDAEGRERLFVQMLGAGFDAAVVHGLPLGLKRRFGRLAYVLQTLATLPGHRFAPLRFRADGGEWEEAAGLLVMKGRFYAGRYLVAPGAAPTDPGFVLVVQRRAGRLGTLLAGALLPLDLMHRLPFLELRRCETVEMDGAGVALQADGDPAGFLPVAVGPAPCGLDVFVP